MRLIRLCTILVICTSSAMICGAAPPIDNPGRTELKRADLSGAPSMEVISSVIELKPGEGVRKHLHHGTEASFVVQGAMVQYPGQAPIRMETGTAILNLRDAAHAGFHVVGTESLKIFAVHVVDKGKPLYDWTE